MLSLVERLTAGIVNTWMQTIHPMERTKKEITPSFRWEPYTYIGCDVWMRCSSSESGEKAELIIDMRSDTVSPPTDAMLDAMRSARVGDEIMGEDPSVNELERFAADLFGKEAAVFTVSGTMSNQIAVMALCDRGDEVILGSESHMYNLEVGGLAALSQVQARTISCPRGYYDPNLVENAIQNQGIQNSKTGLICIENTCDLNRGYPVHVQNIRDIYTVARLHDIPLYMDGARIFNAAYALGVDVRQISKSVDALQICLTKGLCAPFGSLLLGSAKFVKKAKWLKQRLGGGMRQIGYLAAAALVALKAMPPQAKLDNIRAKKLAENLSSNFPGILDITDVLSNIVTINISSICRDINGFQKRMSETGVRIKRVSNSEFRLVCHRGICDSDIDIVLSAIQMSLT